MYVSVAPDEYLVKQRERNLTNSNARKVLESDDPKLPKRLRMADYDSDWRDMFRQIAEWATNGANLGFPILQMKQINDVIPTMIKALDAAAKPTGQSSSRADSRQSPSASAGPKPKADAAKAGPDAAASASASAEAESDRLRDPSDLAAAGAQAASDHMKQLIQGYESHIKEIEARYQAQMSKMTAMVEQYERRAKAESEERQQALMTQKEEFRKQMEQLRK